MSDIGIITIIAASSSSNNIEFETTISDIVCPFNTTVQYGILTSKKNVTFSVIQDTPGTIINVPAISFQNYGPTGSGEFLTVLNVEADADYITTYFKIKAQLSTNVIAFSNRFRILPELDFGVTQTKTITINNETATTSVYDNAAQNFEIPIIKTFEIAGLQPQGQIAYTTPGTYNWTVPAGVSQISMVGIGGGGAGGSAYGAQLGYWGKGGAGGALAWSAASVTPGDNIKIIVGAGGYGSLTSSPGATAETTYICHVGNNCAFLSAGGGQSGGTGDLSSYTTLALGGIYTVDGSNIASGGGNGGAGGGIVRVTDEAGNIVNGYPGGGGGAGGYAGNGGSAGPRSAIDLYGQTGSGGGGGGGYRQAGGGTGIWQIGLNGAGGQDENGQRGANGSIGGTTYRSYGTNNTETSGYYGHGASGQKWPGNSVNYAIAGNSGSNGAVRIVWGGSRRYSNDAILANNNNDVQIVNQGEVLNFTADTPIIKYTLSGTIPQTVDSEAKDVERAVQFEQDNNEVSIIIPVIDDPVGTDIGSNIGNFSLSLSATTDSYAVQSNNINLAILSNPNPPLKELGFADETINIDEGTAVTLTIRRVSTRNSISDLTKSVEVNWSIYGADGISAPDSRWNNSTGTVTIPIGIDNATISLSLSSSGIDLESITNILKITSAEDPRYQITNECEITINNIYRSISIEPSVTATEGENAELAVTRIYRKNGIDITPPEEVNVYWGFTTSISDSRISTTSGVLQIPLGETTSNIVIPINNQVGLQQPSFNTVRLLSSGVYPINVDARNCTLRVNDTITEIKQLSIATPNVEIDEGLTFTIIVSRVRTIDGISALSDTPSFAWSLSNTDNRFSVTSGIKTFAAEEDTVSIVIPTFTTPSYIGDKTATLTIYNQSNLYTIIGSNSITLTILEDNIAPTIDVILSNQTIRAGQSISATVNTQNVSSGASYKYLINNISTTNFDFSEFADQYNFDIVNNGSLAYSFSGQGLTNFDNPNIVLERGKTYTFSISATSHPFYIKTSRVTGSSQQYVSGITNNGIDSGTITFEVPLSAPDTLYYICGIHSVMSGSITIVNSSVLSDTFYISDNVGNFNIQTVADVETADETFSISILDNNDVQVYTSPTITIKPSVEFSLSTIALDEGSTLNAVIYSASSGIHSYTLSGSNITANDFTSNITGTFTPTAINDAYAYTLPITIKEDAISEGIETFIISVTDPFDNVFNSPSITINDTSETPSTGVQTFLSTGSWIVPSGVTSVSAFLVGAGGGGAGHLLSGQNGITNTGSGGGGAGGSTIWAETVPVTPGELLNIIIGNGGSAGTAAGTAGGNGGTTSIKRGSSTLLEVGGGGGGKQTWALFDPYTISTGGVTENGGSANISYTIDPNILSAGNFAFSAGGAGGSTDGQRGGGGGGAGGYTGQGGSGAGRTTQEPSAGSGGGGGGAHESTNFYFIGAEGGVYDPNTGGGGGGVGLTGTGVSGAAGTQGPSASYTIDKNGKGGSSGEDGTGTGGVFGGGGGGSSGGNSTAIPGDIGASGAKGAVRLVWGTGYAYPNNAV
jgi:hypothetical protein